MSTTSYEAAIVSNNTAGKEDAPETGGRSLRKAFLHGGITLGAAYSIEKGLSFIGSLFAARIAGSSTFGAYALALSTASMVASYSGAGIGTTANRFSGQFPQASAGYRGFVRALTILGLGSAALATCLTLVGSGPLARTLLHNSSLTPLLRQAALMGGAAVLLECCKGFLIGQQHFRGLLLLSGFAGCGLLVALPAMARFGPAAMIAGQTSAAFVAIGGLALAWRRLGLSPNSQIASDEGSGPRLRSVMFFGLVQLGGVAGINIASWWIATLVARSDPSLHQMGLYSVASQLRVLASIAPGLLGQAAYPLLNRESGSSYGGPDRVMVQSALLSTLIATAAAGAIMVLLPWALSNVYGNSFLGADAAAGLLLGTAVIQMGGGPAANRLSIVKPKALAVVNAVWAVVVCGLGSIFALRWGAAGAAGALLCAHACSQVLVMFYLKQCGALPRGLLRPFFASTGGAIVIAALVLVRAYSPASSATATYAVAVTCGLMAVLLAPKLRLSV